MLAVLALNLKGFAQSTISGFVTDSASGENLIGATILEVKKGQGTITNTYGFYSLTVSVDTTTVLFSYVGFNPVKATFLLTKDTVVNVRLVSAILDEVVIIAEQLDESIQSTRMSTVSVPMVRLRKLPALMGETDLMKNLQLLPGVQSGAEGSTGLYVRGGGQDQNLILLDGVPVYNPSHLYGFFSTFNPDAINHVELTKGGFPARYGGRLSSVVDISMKEGNQKEFHAQGSIGLISAKLFVEGPIKVNKTSYAVSGRSSYLNLLQAPIVSQQLGTSYTGYHFYDLNGKINHQINSSDRIYFSLYNGQDRGSTETEDLFDDGVHRFQFNNNSRIEWGNTLAAARWSHVFGKRFFSNFTATYSRYHYDVLNEVHNETLDLATGELEEHFYSAQYHSSIRDLTVKADLDLIPNPRHYVRFGAQEIYHKFAPGVIRLESSDEGSQVNSQESNIGAHELSAYAEDDIEITRRLKCNVGIHTSLFLVDQSEYSSLQPRISARYLFQPTLSFKASFATMQQYIHLLTNSGLGLPTDLWVPATKLVPPQSSAQIAVGIDKSFGKGFEASIEGYYKTMNNSIEYKDGANFLNVNEDWQNKIEVGEGVSKGLEFFFQKKFGQVSGWLGYTLSRTERRFDNLNNGEWFPYRYDRTHDAKVSVIYTPNARLEGSIVWVFGTGNAVSVPLEWYEGASSNNTDAHLFGDPVTHYEDRNGFRMANYHRLDLNLSMTFPTPRLEHKVSFSIYNAYNRKNPYYYEFGFHNNSRALKQVSLFPFLPSVTYSVKL